MSRLRRGPFSRPLAVDEIPDDGLETTIEATRDECAAVAADIGLRAIGALSAHYRIDHRAGGCLVVEGSLSARITQTCVVSLESFETDVDQAIALTFAPAVGSTEPRDHRRRKGRDDDRRPGLGRPDVGAPSGEDGRDPPDPIIGGVIDLGSVAVEFLVLALDPHPRKPGVHFTDVSLGEKTEPEPSPFAALERLKDRL